MAEPRRAAVLISGRGSNLQALIDATARPGASARIALVLSNRADAAGLERARAAGIPTAVLDHRLYPDRQSFEHSLTERLQASGTELVCLAGFMRVLSPWMVARWRDRMLNIHPSLLPAFPGLDTHRRALEAGVRVHGCTVHVVTEDLDAGPIVVQGALPVAPDDTADSLAARVLELEHRCYPLALELLAARHARVEDGRVVLREAARAAGALINPPA